MKYQFRSFGLSRATRPVDHASKAAEARSEKRRLAILHAARDLVAELGFHDAQMTAVAERAGVALGTLYRYFPSKAALMVEVVSLVAGREIEAAAIAGSGKKPAERLALSAWTFANRALRGRHMAHALIAEAVEPEIESERLKQRRKLAHVFESIIEEGIRARVFQSQDVQAAGACIVGSLFEGLVGPLAREGNATAEERLNQARAIVRFCLRGVAGTGVRVRLD